MPSKIVKEKSVPVNIAETFELLFDQNNNIAYKALQELQKESEETNCVYVYMDRLGDMLARDKPELRNLFVITGCGQGETGMIIICLFNTLLHVLLFYTSSKSYS